MRKRVPYRENPGCARKRRLESPVSGSTPPRGHRIRARPIFIPGRKIAAFTLTAVYKDDTKICTMQNAQVELGCILPTPNAPGRLSNAHGGIPRMDRERRLRGAYPRAYGAASGYEPQRTVAAAWYDAARGCIGAAPGHHPAFAAARRKSPAGRDKKAWHINIFISIHIDLLEKAWYCIAMSKA